MKVFEIYPRISNRILVTDIADLKQPLTIKSVEITGEDKKTVWLEFENTTLRHKCSKKDVFILAEQLKTNETDEFIGKLINLKEVEGKVVIPEKQIKK